ncbi:MULTISPECIES: short chain isoprenyl diphosphate synthase IdsA [Methanosphaera]|jgi:geranylgeranyl diphosphate synthase type I|uniref:IdsA n=1 Tax=Methanosphaera stadtmanae (strain ATCC 43021 / DSM 3091 / JCM 11832 / MCB-3) TaxID=339860 RepID=Q2NG10_METST|nr:short chain isoprenyl diphosphate synthase IdsA [Methanosphaera stadtmanae]ABC57243.1 IdsA [Methanosphaera stadtmanae DSM 3091]MEE0490296.1 short chain isoprenyl diphosphate synthase IdsA [Methanosphaera stadtmanae]OEC86168.1 serralysin [Methanosphaera sp. A6]RAP47284.1 MAG: serralysin [Methanosphaera sp. DEW79]
MDVMEILKAYAEEIDVVIDDSLSKLEPESLYESSEYLIKAGGKKFRPALTLLSCQAVGGKPEKALKAAAAIELTHTFSLIHDDIMDNDDTRRGKPAVHKVWGEPLAILAGDSLFAKSFELLSQSAEDNIAYERVVDALQVLTNSCINICEGQALDMAFEDTFNVTKDEYMNMIYKKTGDLITASTTIGAIMGGASSNEIQALRTYGKQIGLAFQIQDDYIDLTGDESIGKPVGSDLVEGKKTLMVVYALEKANKEDHDRLVELLEANDESIIPEAMEILEKYGAINYARSKAYDCVIESKQALSILPDSDAKDALFKLADFVFTRKS